MDAADVEVIGEDEEEDTQPKNKIKSQCLDIDFLSIIYDISLIISNFITP